MTRSRSGPGQTSSLSPARYAPRTGSTGQLGQSSLGNRRSYAPVFDDDDTLPSPRLRVRDLVDHLDYISGDEEEASLGEFAEDEDARDGGGAGSRRRHDRRTRNRQRGRAEEREQEGQQQEVYEAEPDEMRAIDDDELEAYVDELEIYTGDIDDIDD